MTAKVTEVGRVVEGQRVFTVLERKPEEKPQTYVAYNRELITLEELVKILSNGGAKTIENTRAFQEHSSLWLDLKDQGTRLHGYYRINYEGDNLDEMFLPMWNNKSAWDALPFKERAYFHGGRDNLTVLISNISDGEKVKMDGDRIPARLVVYANGMPQLTPPVAVVDRTPTNGHGSESKRNSVYVEVHEIVRE
ncbi:MAG: hypothetical protein KGH64_02420 [Candidatus Micrarchaeota archaeon]|nr:hypothetical protein [Candidatus Micrarchaeota archaeon]MDE1834169.1 hypothetical protein [Candidatus Micrarchaeota archaeon]MDE1858978.1 hypothetical protein [Candidatus Micrarchaeota archaeon]